MTSQAKIVAAIGNFDGVHLGHQFLIERTRDIAERVGARAGVVVFEPHPRRFFRPETPPFRLTTPAQRDALLRAHGVDAVFELCFDQAMASMSPEAFVKDVLSARLGLKGVVTGAEFRFGAKRAGDAASLVALCAANGLFAEIVTPEVHAGGEGKISSSDVRKALTDGAPDVAAQLLGRPFAIVGDVVEGQRLGRTLGFPTANVRLGDYIEPAKGVYVVRVRHDGREYGGVANFGRRPTVGAPAPLLEAHLFDFDGALYGEAIEVAFLEFIRAEKKFDGLDALKAQIETDCATARRLLRKEI